jgi:hypothetical protein
MGADQKGCVAAFEKLMILMKNSGLKMFTQARTGLPRWLAYRFNKVMASLPATPV